jgi:lipopolysaccharide export system protein LptC
MTASTRLFALLVLLALALASWLWSGRDSVSPVDPLARTSERPLDYRIAGLDVTRMTPAGQPAHRLQAAQLEHFSDDDTSLLNAPRLTVYGEDGTPPWRIDAERARLSADGTTLDLLGAVDIKRAGNEQQRAMHIVTSNLRVVPGADYAETEEAVRVTSESDLIDAVGMQAWFGPSSRIKFLSQVRGRYAMR